MGKMKMLTFHEYLTETNALHDFFGKAMGAMGVSGTGNDLTLSSPTIDIPTKKFVGRVAEIAYTENPIRIKIEVAPSRFREWPVTFQQWRLLQSMDREPTVNRVFEVETYLDGTIKSLTPLKAVAAPPRTVQPTPPPVPLGSKTYPKAASF